MRHDDTASFLHRSAGALSKGPVAVILVEDEVEVASTLRHHLARGFNTVLALGMPVPALPEDLEDRVHVITADVSDAAAAMNPLIDAASAGVWFYYGYNAEFLFYPFTFSGTINVNAACFDASEVWPTLQLNSDSSTPC